MKNIYLVLHNQAVLTSKQSDSLFYTPPFKLVPTSTGLNSESKINYQNISWELLKKALNGLINKANTINLRSILPEIFKVNIVRGRGIFCRSLMKSQTISPNFTPAYLNPFLKKIKTFFNLIRTTYCSDKQFCLLNIGICSYCLSHQH
jgi:hypothetical protein